MAQKREQILMHLGKTDHRIEVMRSICWRMLYEKRPCPNSHRDNLLRRNLVGRNHKLTHLGECYAKRWHKAFYDMRPPEANKEAIAKMIATRERNKQNKG